MSRILIAEDDPRIGASLEIALRSQGWKTDLVDNGEKAQSLSLTDEFDLLILDMGLPGRDGLAVLEELRSRAKSLPVLVLTGRTEFEVTMCLYAGADDYMTKPFQYDELFARVRARLRSPRRNADPNVLRIGALTLDRASRRATVGDHEVYLSAREFSLTEALIRRAGQILTRRQLYLVVCDQPYHSDTVSNVVDVTVDALRKKLGPGVIETIGGAGYRVARGVPRPRSSP